MCLYKRRNSPLPDLHAAAQMRSYTRVGGDEMSDEAKAKCGNQICGSICPSVTLLRLQHPQ